MIVLRDDAVLRITAREKPTQQGGRVLLSFTGFGHRMGGLDVQSPEF